MKILTIFLAEGVRIRSQAASSICIRSSEAPITLSAHGETSEDTDSGLILSSHERCRRSMACDP